MLRSWLGPAADTFFRESFQRTLFAQPGIGKDAVPFLTWETVDRIVGSSVTPDALVVQNGALLTGPMPTSMEDVRALLKLGRSVVVRRAERNDAGIRAMTDAFEREFGWPATIQIFVTPKGHHSFGWHYDVEDVFIFQTAGSKEYFLRQNTVNPQPTVANMPKDLQYERERTPMASCTMIAGDMLYMPSGWWHVARCLEDSLSISVGILSPYARGTR